MQCWSRVVGRAAVLAHDFTGKLEGAKLTAGHCIIAPTGRRACEKVETLEVCHWQLPVPLVTRTTLRLTVRATDRFLELHIGCDVAACLHMLYSGLPTNIPLPLDQ